MASREVPPGDKNAADAVAEVMDVTDGVGDEGVAGIVITSFTGDIIVAGVVDEEVAGLVLSSATFRSAAAFSLAAAAAASCVSSSPIFLSKEVFVFTIIYQTIVV